MTNQVASSLREQAEQPEDFNWALERVTNLCASALCDAQVYRQKLLKGFGYPNETFRAAQDYRALKIVLEALAAQRQAGRAEALREAEIIANFILGWFPGYEDAVHWGSDGPDGSKPETNEVYQAAKRISEHLAALRAAGQETAVVHCGFCQSAPCECPPPDHERP